MPRRSADVDDALAETPAPGTRKAIRNTANVGWFSADRTIREYARDIWGVPVMK